MLDRGFRVRVEERLRPPARGLRRIGLTANGLTLLGLANASVTAVLVGQGRFGWAAVALVATSIPDVLDGAVAKATGTDGPRGAFLDSVADRVTDALVLGGAAWWYAGTGEPRLAVLPLAVLALSMLISYERARAEGLGFDARGGLMERAERLAALFAGLAFGVLTPVLWAMLVLSALTAVQRFAKVWRQARPASEKPVSEQPASEQQPGDHPGQVRRPERPRVKRLAEWWPTLLERPRPRPERRSRARRRARS